MANSFDIYGTREGPIKCQPLNTGLYATILESRRVKWIVSGEDCMNDFYGNYHGIDMAYSRVSSEADCPDGKGLKPGARIFELKGV